MRYLKLVFALILLLAVLAFVAGNTAPVTIHFLLWQTPGVSLSLVAAVFFVLGILFTLTLWLLFRLKKSSGKLKQGKVGVSENTKKGSVTEPPKAEATTSQDETIIIGKEKGPQ